jgi:hypothetical protein
MRKQNPEMVTHPLLEDQISRYAKQNLAALSATERLIDSIADSCRETGGKPITGKKVSSE